MKIGRSLGEEGAVQATVTSECKNRIVDFGLERAAPKQSHSSAHEIAKAAAILLALGTRNCQQRRSLKTHRL